MKIWLKEEVDMLISLLKEGKTYSQICDLLNLSDGTLRSKLGRLKMNKKTFKLQKKECEYCGSEFPININRNCDKERKYCNRSCSAYATNLKLGKNIHGERNNRCLNCDNIVNKYSTYCDNTCYAKYKQKLIFKEIENGDIGQFEGQYRKFLINKYGSRCMDCGWCEINKSTGNVPIQMEHIDGDAKNNSLNNLKLLCPNCHSLTPTYGNLNKGNGRDERKIYRDFIKNLELDELIIEKQKLKGEHIKPIIEKVTYNPEDRRKVVRPPYDELMNEINELGYSGTGRKYGVSDNSIRKWKKYYEK